LPFDLLQILIVIIIIIILIIRKLITIIRHYIILGVITLE